MNINDSEGAVFDVHRASEKLLFSNLAHRNSRWKGEILHKFAKLVENSGLTRSTAMFHLEHLEESSSLTREDTPDESW
ncbi:MAG: hypothetical protein JRN59_07070 [Nitrososphaerota archaeon]|nr:hypothetical protein [Nitrososphaerota archaeon]